MVLQKNFFLTDGYVFKIIYLIKIVSQIIKLESCFWVETNDRRMKKAGHKAPSDPDQLLQIRTLARVATPRSAYLTHWPLASLISVKVTPVTLILQYSAHFRTVCFNCSRFLFDSYDQKNSLTVIKFNPLT